MFLSQSVDQETLYFQQHVHIFSESLYLFVLIDDEDFLSEVILQLCFIYTMEIHVV